ncbi:MAG: DUF6745 domain-containing protein [Nostoc sp.]|uniref:DUF6745 domain-containing protein n=1 Tax=Nostoc sp. TaxID=1180 RepID=UPI002FF7A6BA
MITKFTPQQQELIASYQRKWRAISLSTERIDRKRLLAVLEEVYSLYPEGGTMPEVIFFESPYAAFSAELILATANFNGLTDDEIINEVASLQTLRGEGQVRTDLWFNLHTYLSPNIGLNPQINQELWEVLTKNLVDEVGMTIHEQLWKILWNWLTERLWSELKDTPDAYYRFYNNFIDRDSEWASYAGLFDFCINELSYQHEQEEWNVYQAVCSECGWWFLPSPRHYIICDRPTKLLLDDQGKLHADEEPAIQFADGFGVYARHGEIYSICFP